MYLNIRSNLNHLVPCREHYSSIFILSISSNSRFRMDALDTPRNVSQESKLSKLLDIY
nr:MAG TPA: hypothetical protein [Caudoviricetes sp.]